jgi:hypothetical protein
MDVFTMVLGVVTISVAGGLIGQNLKNRGKALDLQLKQGGAPIAAEQQQSLQREVAQLRERVAALEAIVTEPAFDLKHEFRKLERESAGSG